MPEHIYLVWEHDGTSFSGAPKLIGATTDRAVADAAASAIHERNNWHSGGVSEAKVLS